MVEKIELVYITVWICQLEGSAYVAYYSLDHTTLKLNFDTEVVFLSFRPSVSSACSADTDPVDALDVAAAPAAAAAVELKLLLLLRQLVMTTGAMALLPLILRAASYEGGKSSS